jgi:single-stranded-DNA-specific exonuclease
VSDRIQRPWKIHRVESSVAAALARQVAVSPLIGQFLANRGITSPAAASRWLEVPRSDLPTPDAVPGSGDAGKTLAAAAAAGAKVCIYGDYDVDGTTGSTTLYRILNRLGAVAEVYTPHRLEEGYGLNETAIRRIARAGFTHLVTVDCGVTSVKEIAVARSLGMTVIVTDHHQPKEELPQDATLVHPGLPGIVAAAPNLCGSAVAWTVARATVRAMYGGSPPDDIVEMVRDGMAMAAVGTVADVVPLIGENRAVVRHGLHRLSQTEHPGLAALVRVCGLTRRVESEDVGFQIGPRINAAGRLGAASRVIDLLGRASSPLEADKLAEYLNYANALRQKTERDILREARDQAAEQVALGRPGVVVASANWHPGIIGIVASRLVERFGRPALIVSFGTRSGLGYGSGRSIPGLALHEALRACGDHLLSHGGHAMAAGFKVAAANLENLRHAFWGYCESRYGGPPPPPPIVAECSAHLADITVPLIGELAKLEPHGAANPRPFFFLKGCRVEQSKRIGAREDHLSVTVSHPGVRPVKVRGVGFGMGERAKEMLGFVDVIAVPKINEWQGRRSAELEIKDFRATTRD